MKGTAILYFADSLVESCKTCKRFYPTSDACTKHGIIQLSECVNNTIKGKRAYRKPRSFNEVVCLDFIEGDEE